MTAKERKDKTESFLREQNIPVNIHLPLTEDDNEAKIRDAGDIAKRLLALTYLNIAADNGEKTEIINFLKSENIWDAVSENEKELFLKDKLTEKEEINISWRSEAIWLMLWAINKADISELPNEQCVIPKMLDKLPEYLSSTTEFIKTAKRRTITEILDMSDLLYRIHWATRQAQIDGKDIPGGLDAGIVYERHYAINWITNYGENWDDITTDT
ncbi:MAG: DUF4272 domain-containing protein [Bacteroidota bacterium]|nr:DUF4272 domain-containing protein [Bacteroidota bacterium]